MIYAETDIYKLNGDKQELPGFDKKYHNIVDYILKITEEIWEQRKIWVIYDTYAEDIVIHTGAETLTGIDGVITGTVKKLGSFPDRKMIGEAVIWSNENDNSFYSSHRIYSTATNTGNTEFGKYTGKKVAFRTIADCIVSENKIYEEWLVRDNMYLIQQLGFDPIEQAKKDTRYNGKEIEKLFVVPNEEHTFMPLDNEASRLVMDLFTSTWKRKDFSRLDKFYSKESLVHAICNIDLKGPAELRSYLEKLISSFPDAQVEVERISSNQIENEYEVAVRWKLFGYHEGEGLFGQPTQKPVHVSIICHYLITDGVIIEEWMVFDAFDVLCQVHSEPVLNNADTS